MSMFLSKFLTGRNISKSNLELLSDAWLSIQKYYETAADPLKDAVDLTPIPCCLQNIVKLIQAEELEYERAPDSLETGPCLEFLLHKRVLEELVEFAKVDTPYGMRIHCLRFFCSLVTNVQAQLLPERAVHVPLHKLINSCHRLIAHHYEQLATDADGCSEERYAAISELSLELVKLMHGVFSHFKGANAALMDLFFERGWCRGLGENVWRSSKDGKTFHKRRESMDEKIAWTMFLMPRFDMFSFLIDYMNIPGETGEIAREAILFALRLLDGDPEYVCYVVEYSGLCEVMAERLSLSFASLPKNVGSFTISANNRVVPTRPPKRPIHFSVPAMITNHSLMITVNVHNSFKKKRRKRSPFDVNFVRTLDPVREGERGVDEFYSFWEYLNDVARVADRRLMIALMAQLTTIFWHPVVCTALSSSSAEAATAATAYTTEMIRSLTDQKLLHAFLVVLVGEEGGIGKDLEPEIRTLKTYHDLIEDESVIAADDDQSERTESDKEDKTDDNDDTSNEAMTLRVLLVTRIDSDYQELSLATLRLFDTVLETYNQFAIYNLVLRNFLDIAPDGEYIEEKHDGKDMTDSSSMGSKAIDDHASATEEDSGKIDDLAIAEPENEEQATTHVKDNKTEKVRWLVERVLSLLPLEDELERMKTPPLCSVIPSDSFASTVHGRDNICGPSISTSTAGGTNGSNNSHHSSLEETATSPASIHNVVVPGNSYDDYFHEAQERFQYGLLARNFWQTPYPPPKTRRDYERESEDQKGRPPRPTKADDINDSSADEHGIEVSSSQGSVISSHPEGFEGLFLSQIFDQFFKMLECTMEQNLLVTSILQKIAGIVDRRVDGVICDWRAVRVGIDGALYGGVWTLPSAKNNRRSLYSLLEQVTFEALKRAQLVPNFETRISLAKKRGVMTGGIIGSTSNSTSSANGQLQPPPPHHHHHNHHHHHQPQLKNSRSATSYTLTPSISSPQREVNKQMARHPSLSQLVFSKSAAGPRSNSSPTTSISTQSTSLLPGGRSGNSNNGTRAMPPMIRESLSVNTNLPPVSASSSTTTTQALSPSSSFFQQAQRSNATPVTMTNPFAKLSNFVNSYIVLQEFCKELAAVILVRHATNYDDIGFVRYQNQQRPSERVDAWVHEEREDTNNEEDYKLGLDKWKNRISMVSTLADWKSVRSMDTIDEAITSRVSNSSHH
ncbi:Retinoic acid induced 16-like protein-domain-containing protein [Phycomyces nitens]|nr:Retinoic acid induced 16-like protein-domain-containing protein [Phycomyces nitens]